MGFFPSVKGPGPLIKYSVDKEPAFRKVDRSEGAGQHGYQASWADWQGQ